MTGFLCSKQYSPMITQVQLFGSKANVPLGPIMQNSNNVMLQNCCSKQQVVFARFWTRWGGGQWSAPMLKAILTEGWRHSATSFIYCFQNDGSHPIRYMSEKEWPWQQPHFVKKLQIFLTFYKPCPFHKHSQCLRFNWAPYIPEQSGPSNKVDSLILVNYPDFILP